MAQHRPKSRQTSSGLSAAGQNIVGGNKTYGGGALGLQNKAGFHQDPNEQALSDKYPVDIDKIIHESRMKNMARNLPKKQGRMFGIELGQNDGPFKQKEVNGCPQIDKFATYSINSIAKGRTSPRIGILGVSTYPHDMEYMTSNIG